MHENIKPLFISIVVEHLGVPESDVKLSSTFSDLGADSLDEIEIVMAAEDQFDIEIGDEDAEKLTTVGDAINYLNFVIRASAEDKEWWRHHPTPGASLALLCGQNPGASETGESLAIPQARQRTEPLIESAAKQNWQSIQGPQFKTIEAGLQEGVIGSFWQMLRQLESSADDKKNMLEKHFVEGWYAQWNEMTGDDKQPMWKTR